jgi:hypothetical protein
MIFNTRGNRYAIEGSIERFKRMELSAEHKHADGENS